MEKDADGFERLYESHLKARRGVIWKDSVAWFSLHGADQVLKLANELKNGTYEPKPPVSFTIYKPKKRDILAVAYRDRVYQRSINDNILYPVITRSFIKENTACQIGKGTDFAINLFRKQLRRFYINHGRNGWILQIDVQKYYPSMRHDVVKEMFRKYLTPETYEIVAGILDNQYVGEVGYNPGSQMVQIAGISLLNGIDHFIKQKLHVKDYIRVMDDMILLHEDKAYLEHCRDEIRRELELIGLHPHPKKTGIFPISKGVTFLGFDWILTDTGKVLMIPKGQKIKEIRHSTNALLKLYGKGLRTEKCCDDSFESKLSFIRKGNTRQIELRLRRWYTERKKFYADQRQQLLQTAQPVSEGEGRDG